ncbi:hypothetical protein FTO70_03810 [Methanosarcina sp. KYL-1]|uniref:hypothetical protein n=1 Tax=Methanosarcina sp. KYL-1 TaxID=2602068 RepID=UPI002100B185|nr:hypothetical protein [Methanosarcina sp. KYL-1]MCQ1534829.1 hypothetical protein [Methanosarcina sp. KYL-1]
MSEQTRNPSSFFASRISLPKLSGVQLGAWGGIAGAALVGLWGSAAAANLVWSVSNLPLVLHQHRLVREFDAQGLREEAEKARALLRTFSIYEGFALVGILRAATGVI